MRKARNLYLSGKTYENILECVKAFERHQVGSIETMSDIISGDIELNKRLFLIFHELVSENMSGIHSPAELPSKEIKRPNTGMIAKKSVTSIDMFLKIIERSSWKNDTSDNIPTRRPMSAIFKSHRTHLMNVDWKKGQIDKLTEKKEIEKSMSRTQKMMETINCDDLFITSMCQTRPRSTNKKQSTIKADLNDIQRKTRAQSARPKLETSEDFLLIKGKRY